MDAWTIVGLAALGVVLLVVVIGLVGKLTLLAIKGALEKRIAERYRPDEILMEDLGANCFGLESKGVFQARGNGGLVLTPTGLHFFMFLPKWDLHIPLESISDMTFTKSHLGKATIYDLFKVHFTSAGKPDSIAWYLREPRAWKEKIEELKLTARR